MRALTACSTLEILWCGLSPANWRLVAVEGDVLITREEVEAGTFCTCRREKSLIAAGSLSMPPMQRKRAVVLPTRAWPRLKPFAPPPNPQNRWK